MRRDPFTAWLPLRDELIVDSFAGGGGASTGIEAAFGRPVDVAINHDAQALAMHRINHPATAHYCESVFSVDPEEITGNQPVGLAWFSPDCTHFSKAKGGAPRSPRVRGLAWVVIRWARRVKPRVIMLENVEEFQDWGPLRDDGLALRLAVKLRMSVLSNETASWVATGMHQIVRAEEHHDGSDPYAATRRAIVRAAAEIGRSMK